VVWRNAGQGIFLEVAKDTILKNNIVVSNLSGGILDESSGAVIEFNDSFGNLGPIRSRRNYFPFSLFRSPGNLSSNPFFVDASGLDFHLKDSSPLIDAGTTNELMQYDDTTVNGEERDMGAFEFSFTLVKFTRTGQGSLPGLNTPSLSLGDIDNDQDLDLVLTGHVGPDVEHLARVYTNNGSGGYTDTGQLTLPDVAASSTTLGDIDSDGDLDLIITGFINIDGGESIDIISRLYVNDGTGAYSEASGVSLDGVGFSSTSLGDIDNDGDLDLLLAGSGIAKIYENNGTGGFQETAQGSLENVHEASTAFGDINNDGALDFIIAGSGLSVVYTNNGFGLFHKSLKVNLESLGQPSMTLGDIDDDGDLDLILTGFSLSEFVPVSRVYTNHEHGEYAELLQGNIKGIFRGSIGVGDFDNDGDLDLVFTGQEVGGQGSRIYSNNGLGFYTNVETPGLVGVVGSSAALGDIENDGDLDLIISGNQIPGNFFSIIYRNNETRLNSPPSVPSRLQVSDNNGFWRFTWDIPTDDHSSQKMLRYQIAIGTALGKSDIISSNLSLDAPGSKDTSANIGNVILPTNRYDSKIPVFQRVFWKVAAIDTSFKLSVFSGEEVAIPLLALEATLDIDPDTINVKSKGKVITAYIELPPGFDVADIDRNTVSITKIFTNDLPLPIPAKSSPMAIGDNDNDGIPDLMVKFDRQVVHSFLDCNAPDISITVKGLLTSGELFAGTDFVRVIHSSGGPCSADVDMPPFSLLTPPFSDPSDGTGHTGHGGSHSSPGSSSGVPGPIDGSSPLITVSGVENNGFYNSSVNITVAITDPDNDLVYHSMSLDGAPFGDNPDGLLSQGTVTSEKEHILFVFARDSEDNVAIINLSFEIDLTAPVVTISNVEQDATLERAKPTWRATDKNLESAEATLKESLEGNNTSYPTNGFMITNHGDYSLEVEASDLAKNITARTVNFEIRTNLRAMARLSNSFDNSLNADFALGNPTNFGGGFQTTGGEGKFGEGARVDGGSMGIIYLPTNNILKEKGEVSFYFKPEWTETNKPDSENYLFLVEGGSGAGNQRIMEFHIKKNGQTRLRIMKEDGNHLDVKTTDTIWTNDIWHFVTIKWDESLGLLLFKVDSAEYKLEGQGFLIRHPLKRIVIGSKKGSDLSKPMQGIIDDFRIR